MRNLNLFHCSHFRRLRKFQSCKFRRWHNHFQFKSWSLWDHYTVNTVFPTSSFTFPSPWMALALGKLDITSGYRGRARGGGKKWKIAATSPQSSPTSVALLSVFIAVTPWVSEVLPCPVFWVLLLYILFIPKASISIVLANHVTLLSAPKSVPLYQYIYHVECGVCLQCLLFSYTQKASIPNSDHIFSKFPSLLLVKFLPPWQLLYHPGVLLSLVYAITRFESSILWLLIF